MLRHRPAPCKVQVRRQLILFAVCFKTVTGELKISRISSRDAVRAKSSTQRLLSCPLLSLLEVSLLLHHRQFMAELAGGVGKVVVSTPLDAEVEVTCVSVQVGDRVRRGSVVCQYRPKDGAGSTAVQTLKSPVVGIVRRIGVNDGDVVPPR